MTLLGPTGRPISSSEYKKATPPKTGEAFGGWAGRDINYVTMPGGGLVGFDLSKLTVTDYRTMRDHYQVNASLAVLSFMQHQSEFHVECENKKIAEFCEEQLRDIWTPLNRSLATANWAGYSPNVLQWENNLINKSVDLTKVKDLIPEECAVNWKIVEGYAPPNSPKPKFKIYDGMVQLGQPGPIPVDNCTVATTPILMADFTWKKAGDLECGDEIIAFSENTHLYGHRYETAFVDANRLVQEDCMTVESKNGDPITVTKTHPFLVRRGAILTGDKSTSQYKDHWAWVKAQDLKIGDRVGWFGKPFERDNSWEAGYVAAFFDGEGSLSCNGSSSWTLSATQRDNAMLKKVCQILDAKGFEYSLNSNKRDDCKQIMILGGIRAIARFMETFAPVRLRAKAGKMFDGAVMRIGRSVEVTEVTGLYDAGIQTVANVQTSSHTYISAGYLSHNSLWYPLLMENGDYYGRKLLRPAFISWYFSILIHLFANRYYERFGEPTPIGRASFEDEIELPTGGAARGNKYMLSILEQLRNRSVVVLPNDSTDFGNGRREYDYDIEYLESQMRGADFERYLTRLDEEISIGLFTPILLLRTADVGSYNLGVGHMQMYLWMLNAMNNDRADYINKYILSRMADYNFSPSAPRPKIKFRKLGNQNAELLRALVTELTRQGSIKPDIRELGEMAGMSFEEIEATVEDPTGPDGNDPNVDTRIGRPERPESDGPAGVDKARDTTKEITARVAAQVKNAFATRSFGPTTKLNMGYKKRMAESLGVDATERLYRRMDLWLEDAVAIGQESYKSPEGFIVFFSSVLANEIESAVSL